MTGSSLPPEGFRWVEPAQAPPAQAPPARGRRGWVGAVVVLVVLLVAGGVGVVWWSPWKDALDGGHGTDAAPAASPPIGTPKDLLVSFPLTRQPVPGWQLSGPDIGLPAGVKVGDLFAGNGSKAYFIASQGCEGKCAHPVGWLYGIDITSGARLFPPLALPGFYGSGQDCHGNGPGVAVCTSHPLIEGLYPAGGAWVIDLDHGALTYSGPNTLNPTLRGGTQLEAVGYRHGQTYLVVKDPGKGLHGVGPHAEFTWFVPGGGDIQSPATWDPDIPPLTLAVQPPASPVDHRGARVLSVTDGKDLTPVAPQGAKLETAVVYSGGFAYQFDAGKVTGALMYDAAGRAVGRQQPERSYPETNAAMLTLAVGGNFRIYDAAGKLVATIPASAGFEADFKTIGTKLYVEKVGTGDGEQADWQQWDLLTAGPGPTCTMALGSSYVGSDGNVVLTHRYVSGGSDYVAIDTTNCQTLWRLPGRILIDKAGTGLIVHDVEHDTVFSLREPS